MSVYSPDHYINAQKKSKIITDDVRLNKPFESLVKYANSIDLESLSDTDHHHVPYIVLLAKFVPLVKKDLKVEELTFKK